MKIIVLLIFVCFNWINLVAQDICINDSAKYLNAYNYILNDSINQNKSIFVSDIIVDLDRIWFLQDLDSLPNEKELIKSLTKYSWKPDYYSENLLKIFSSTHINCKSKTILFFSWLEKSTLCVEVFHDKKDDNAFVYNRIAFQNESLMYLFIFNSDSQIRYVSRKKLLYSF